MAASSRKSIWVPTRRNGVFWQWWVISGTHFSFTFSNEEGETTLHQHKGSRQKSINTGNFKHITAKKICQAVRLQEQNRKIKKTKTSPSQQIFMSMNDKFPLSEPTYNLLQTVPVFWYKFLTKIQVKYTKADSNPGLRKILNTLRQCCGSVTFLYGSRYGSGHPRIRTSDYSDPRCPETYESSGSGTLTHLQHSSKI